MISEGSTYLKSVGAGFSLAGETVPNDFHYTDAERDAAIEMVASGLQPAKLSALAVLEGTANSAFHMDESKSRIEAAESCKFAGLAWYSVIKELPESRNKNILLAEKVVQFLGRSAGHLLHDIKDKNKSGNVNPLFCLNFLEMQVYVCGLCVAIGKHSIFQDRNRLTSTVNKIMFEKFGAEHTAVSFGQAYELALQQGFSPEVQKVFFKYALENIKYDFYHSPEPTDSLSKFYRKDVYDRLEQAVVNEDQQAETKVREEIAEMFDRDQKLQGNNHAESYAGKQEPSQPHPTLRRRRPKI